MRTRQPHDLDGTDLLLSHFTLGRHHSIEDRVQASAAAGCSGLGLYVGDYRRLEDSGFAPNGLAELLDQHGQCLAEIEVLRGWADLASAGSVNYRELESTAWRMADRFACRYVQAIGPYTGSIADAGRAYAGLCDRAADHGLVVGLEFLPFTNIFSAADALAIVEAADRDNGGICIDIWHHERGAADLEMIRGIPASRVMGIQMSDGPIVPVNDDYYEDCLRNRRPPGDGEFDVSGFVEALRGLGADAPWSLEVCDEKAWATDGGAHVSRCAENMRAFLDRATPPRRGSGR